MRVIVLGAGLLGVTSAYHLNQIGHEAAVVAHQDDEHLLKPKAFVVFKAGQSASDDELKAHVKSKLAPYKYPRWIESVAELPKTATGKIQRFKLRGK